MAVTLRGRELPLPILQGGMGVGVSLGSLAGAVARCGGMGTVSAALCGFDEPDFETDPFGANLRALEKEIRCAKALSDGSGLVAVNVMVATTQYADCVRTAVRAGAHAVVCGAGLAKDLPAIAKDAGDTSALAPIVSSGRAAGVLCRLWDSRYHTVPDFFVLEGPLAGGHLGFSPEEAAAAQAGRPVSLDALLTEVLSAIAPYREKYGRDIPVFTAGGVKGGAELAHYQKLGAAGAQFATRFIATEECDAADGLKQALVRAKASDIVIVKSPVGMPGRALLSPLMRRVAEGTQPPIGRCINCLTPCDRKTAPYCISAALIAAVRGDWENGLFFCGANAGEIKEITTVQEQIDKILAEWRAAQ